uniref:Uncharacterized protein n=1 Tax=Arundo donax TaxID=35708 RepID=A0A0A9B4N3_ARUDO
MRLWARIDYYLENSLHQNDCGHRSNN